MSNRLDNTEVISTWLGSREGRSHTGNLTTDGKRLYSYALVIGDTLAGEKIVLDYTASVGQFQSMTTSQHVGLAKQQACEGNIMHPEAYDYIEALSDF